MSKKIKLTTASGRPVDDNQNSLSAGEKGPLLLQDIHLIEKLAHFDREEIPERIVHAKGAGAFGQFTVTHDITQYTKAKLFAKIGKKTEVFTRFSTVGGERGSADTVRDPRGFATKFYTEEGNWDLVGNNTPIFFLRDPLKFPDFIHTQKRCPATNLKSAQMMWDYWSKSPEATHQVTFLFGPRGIPDGYRYMNGYGSHTFSLINAKNERFWVKFHLKTEQGIKNLSAQDAAKIAGENPDYATEDLSKSISKKDYPKWKMYIQVMAELEAESYHINPFDLTKVWPHKDYPLIEVGILELNRNPVNYFAEVEQAALSPSNIVPGIGFSPDKVLQGRLFSYPDTHRYRLGVNYNALKVNCPHATTVANGYRDGSMRFDDNGGSDRNYEPSHFNVPTESPEFREPPLKISGNADRYAQNTPANNDFNQAGNLYKLLSEAEKQEIVNNIAASLKGVNKDIQQLQVSHFCKCDPQYGAEIAKQLGLDANSIE